MDDAERRGRAWDLALHAEGTRVIFERRAAALRRKIRLRDWSGIAIPFLVAYLLGSEVFELLKPYRHWGIGILGMVAVFQALMVVWSIVARWDEELAYDIRSARESAQLREAWRKLGRGESANLPAEYDFLSRQQAIADSHDEERAISAKEKQNGMRAGLIEMQRRCICGEIPRSLKRPWRIKVKRCIVCGGN